MKRCESCWFALCLAALVWPAASGAQCLTGWDNLTQNDFEYFGALPSGLHSWVGQQFTPDCDGQPLVVSLLVYVEFADLNGVRKLTAGDTVTCTLMNDQNEPIAAVDQLLTGSFGLEQVDFDFGPLELGLAAAQLAVRIDTPHDAYARLGTTGNAVPGDLLVFNGTTLFVSSFRDAGFAVTWDPDTSVVPAEGLTWGASKALYR